VAETQIVFGGLDVAEQLMIEWESARLQAVLAGRHGEGSGPSLAEYRINAETARPCFFERVKTKGGAERLLNVTSDFFG
jgi:hypothetical protein